MTVVELKGVAKEYMLGRTKVEALRGIDLEIEWVVKVLDGRIEG